MPIKPENAALYPADWHKRRPADLARAGYCCQGSPQYPDCRAAQGKPHPVTGARVVLTRGHLNHDPSDDRPENIRVWCQKCHLGFDAAQHAESARKTRERRAGQERLPLEEPSLTRTQRRALRCGHTLHAASRTGRQKLEREEGR